jgi:hypothetical protein
VPSLQQVIKNLYDKPGLVQRELVRTAIYPPRISYRMLHKATQDRVCLNESLEQIEAGIRKVEKRKNHADNLIAILRLIDSHFDTIHPDFPPIEVECRYYRIAPDIIIPFQPPICYGIGGQLYLPYFNFWRNNPLKGKRLSVFMTIIDAIREQEPDLETAIMPILNFGIPQGEKQRKLVVIDDREIVRVTPTEIQRWLQVFAEGYRGARDELSRTQPERRKDRDEGNRPDDGQRDLFGDKPDA